MKIVAMAAGLWALAGACALGGPALAGAGTTTFSTAQGSPYAVAKASCARQGKAIKLMTTQTDDTGLAASGIRVGFVCVAGPAKVKAKARPARRAATPAR